MLQRGGPLEVLDEVVIAGGAGGAVPRHRAWPAVEVIGDSQLLVAYRESLDHNRSDDAAVMLAYSMDGGRTWPLHRAVAAEPGWGCITNHGLTRLAGGTLVLPIHRERNVQPAHRGSGSTRECRTSFTRSSDGGTLWDASGPDVQFAELSPDYAFAYGRIQELAGGRLMAPFAGIPRDAGTSSLRSVGVGFSHDQGRTWSDF